MDDDAMERDPDLVTLEALESELGDLDAELAQAERSEGSAVDDSPRPAPSGDG